MTTSPPVDRRSYVALASLTLVVLGLTTTLVLAPGEVSGRYAGRTPEVAAGYFAPYLGSLPPLPALGVVAGLGLVGLNFLQARWRLVVLQPETGPRRLLVATLAGMLFGTLIVVAEVTGSYQGPADLNVPPPYSMLFYPVIGYVVEIVFKILPLALLLAMLELTRGRRVPAGRTPSVVWPFLLVAALEPAYQLARADSVSWEQAYVGAHVYAINLVQLYLFRRYDFVTMYWFRLVYYAIWHVGWGYLRLSVLF